MVKDRTSESFDINNRRNIFDLLKCPDEYELEFCVGTSYTLEPSVLLFALMCFNGKDLEKIKTSYELNKTDLESWINPFSERAIFFIDRKGNKGVKNELESYLYHIIRDIQLNNGSFHPKFWLIKYTPSNQLLAKTEKKREKFRLILSSKNLVRSNSWEFTVSFDGEKNIQKQSNTKNNKELINFLKKLMTCKDESNILKDKKHKISKLIDDLKNVEFKYPYEIKENESQFLYGWNDKSLYPKQILKEKFAEYKELLIVSPFIDINYFLNFAPKNKCTLITRQEELNKLKFGEWEQLKGMMKEIWVMTLPDRIGIKYNEDEYERGLNLNKESEIDYEEEYENRGLHAKLFLGKKGSNLTEVWIGSANATNRGWGFGQNKNCEVMYRLICKKDYIKDIKDNFIKRKDEDCQFCEEYIREDIYNDDTKKQEERKKEIELNNLKEHFLKFVYSITFGERSKNKKDKKVEFNGKIKFCINNWNDFIAYKVLRGDNVKDVTFKFCNNKSLNLQKLEKNQGGYTLEGEDKDLKGFITIAFTFYDKPQEVHLSAETNLYRFKDTCLNQIEKELEGSDIRNHIYDIIHRNDAYALNLYRTKRIEQRKNGQPRIKQKQTTNSSDEDLCIEDILDCCFLNQERVKELDNWLKRQNLDDIRFKNDVKLKKEIEMIKKIIGIIKRLNKK